MEQFWTSDSKFASHGVDGSLCSFITYLSEVSVLLSGNLSWPASSIVPVDLSANKSGILGCVKCFLISVGIVIELIVEIGMTLLQS